MLDASWTGWMTEAEAHEAFDVLRDAHGNRPKAIEVKNQRGERLFRLLFDTPRMLAAWCVLRLGVDEVPVPAYVALWERW